MIALVLMIIFLSTVRLFYNQKEKQTQQLIQAQQDIYLKLTGQMDENGKVTIDYDYP